MHRELSNGDVSHFVFLPDGRLLGEYDGTTGNVIAEYIWFRDRLVGSVDGAGVLSYVLTGHLGQPLIVMDGAGSPLWQREISPFGTYVYTSGTGDDPDLRLPGQWLEEGSGLYQNWHRDYDPQLGRYMQPDPLGLAAGQSLYGYVGGNPINAIDPDGRIGLARGGLLVYVAVQVSAAMNGELEAMEEEACRTGSYGVGSKAGAYKRVLGAGAGAGAGAVIDWYIPGPAMGLPFVTGPFGRPGGPKPKGGGANDGPWGPRIGQSGGRTAAPDSLWQRFLRDESGSVGGSRWKFGSGKSATKWSNRMAKRGWTTQQISEAIRSGRQFPATNNLNPTNGATRFVHPVTGRSVVRDNKTMEIIHIGGDGYVY